MKVTKVSVLVSKKVSGSGLHKWDSFSVSLGATAELHAGDDWRMVREYLELQLKDDVNTALGQSSKPKQLILPEHREKE